MNHLPNNNLKVYYDAGKALLIPSEEVGKEVEEIKNKYQLKSDDIHILGLAKASNAKVLCTKDKKITSRF